MRGGFLNAMICMFEVEFMSNTSVYAIDCSWESTDSGVKGIEPPAECNELMTRGC